MKHLRTFFAASLLVILAVFPFMGCGNTKQTNTFPFTKMTWQSTLDDVLAAEGEDYTTYDSVYNGTTYVFPKTYLELEGTIKYMFDDSNKLMCVAWSYDSASQDDVESTYDQIHKQLKERYGESGYDAGQSVNALGDVWYLDDGNIILSAVTTDSQKALQYAYLSPEVSTPKTKN